MRASRLPTEDRKRIASLGGQARAHSLHAARRIAENFRYVAALRDLQGPSTRVMRLSAFDGRLPGIYPADH
ncbi:MAG: hypothetical protein GEU99_07720 [Luteitalea sp.]|nr:hypothetical protein [Luteitalea sp.]